MISFSGLDGCGKGTQINLFEAYLKNRNICYKTIWARGSWTPGLELIKKIVRQDKGFTEEQKEVYRKEARSNPRKQKIILVLSIIDLYWFFGIYYRIIQLTGKILICDRYIWDTVVDFRVNFSTYNFENWLLWKLLLKIIPDPHTSLIFVISAEQSIERGILKQETHMEDLEVKIMKAKEYLKLIKEGKWNCVIDGNLNISILHNLVKQATGYEN
jgi:thymidylate kinase